MSVPGHLTEVFASFQGEGPLVGVRQIFLRLQGCELTCRYCDTPGARRTGGDCRVEDVPASDRWRYLPNPLTSEELLPAITALAGRFAPHSVSITGGEPLLQADFLASLLPRLREAGLKTYLDTACCYPEAMAQLAPCLDWVSADLKLPVTMGTPVPFADFAACWQTITGRRFVKIVLTADVTAEQLATACAQLAALDAGAEVILQPVTPRAGLAAPGPEQLFTLAAACAAHFPTCRLIPQCHPLMGVK